MARLHRLVVAGLPHQVVQRGHNGQPVFADEVDRDLYLTLLRETAAAHGLAVHAYVLLDAEVRLLVTPRQRDALGRVLQALGRRYVSAFNRRHGRSGTLWEGRFRAGVIEPDLYLLAAMRAIEQAPRHALHVDPTTWHWSSAGHHLGRLRDPVVSDHPLFWALGNTPFEREMAWKRRLEEPTPAAEAQALEHAACGGWALGSPAFLDRLAATTPRPLRPRPRGRPKKATAGAV